METRPYYISADLTSTCIVNNAMSENLPIFNFFNKVLEFLNCLNGPVLVSYQPVFYKERMTILSLTIFFKKAFDSYLEYRVEFSYARIKP